MHGPWRGANHLKKSIRDILGVFYWFLWFLLSWFFHFCCWFCWFFRKGVRDFFRVIYPSGLVVKINLTKKIISLLGFVCQMNVDLIWANTCVTSVYLRYSFQYFVAYSWPSITLIFIDTSDKQINYFIFILRHHFK